MKPTIWCLFSIDNDYRQPEHNLVAWWCLKPTLEQLQGILKLTEQKVLKKDLVGIYRGEERRIGNVDYRMFPTLEGVRICNPSKKDR